MKSYMLMSKLNRYIITSVSCIVIAVFFSCNDIFIGEIVDFEIGRNNVHFRYVGKESDMITYCISFEDTVIFQKEFYAKENSYHELPNLRKYLIEPRGEYSPSYSAFKLLYPDKETNETYQLSYKMAKSGCDNIHYQLFQQNILLFDTIVCYNNIPITEINKLYGEIVGKEKFGTICKIDSTEYFKGAKSFLIKNRIREDDAFIHKMAQNVYNLLNNDKTLYLKMENLMYYQEIPQKEVTVRTNMDADFYYLVATRNKSSLKNFVDEEIAQDFASGISSSFSGDKLLHLSLLNVNAVYYNKQGINYVMLVGVDDDWNYKYYPLGALAVDLQGPILLYKERESFYPAVSYRQVGADDVDAFDDFYCDFDYHYHGMSIINSISWGDFEGNNVMGYPITFTVSFEFIGDFSYVEIQHKKYGIVDVDVRNKCLIFTHKVPHLNVGDNYITIKYVDIQGNSTIDKINIQTERVE